MSVLNELKSDSSSNTDHREESLTSVDLYSPHDELLLQQLTQARYWAQEINKSSPQLNPSFHSPTAANILPDEWKLTGGLTLHDWQQQCVNAWFENGKRGVIKVVTGAGKTILALAIAERLQNHQRELRIAVVVPTTILLHQWNSVLSRYSNLPREAIGLLGGGHNNAFNGGVRILICVLNSASKRLPAIVEESGVGNNLLLIVDECHRAGAAQMKQVFRVSRNYDLGLSATPERDDTTDAEDLINVEADRDLEALSFEDSTVGKELGSVVFELNYSQAIQFGVLPPFRVVHYGLSLLPKERERYELLSRQIKDLRSELETSKRRGLALIRWCRSKAAANNPKAARLIALTTERKRLLYRMNEREAAVLQILRNAFEENANTRAILFHESIDEVMNLFAVLRNNGFDVVAEHSKFSDEVRAESLRLFERGQAKIIVSARSLIEGFDVPAADLGIVAAASSSVRQRIQTLGRLLRKSNTGNGEKAASLYVLYANQTVDEMIYAKADWNEFVGADRNEYFLWPDVGTTKPVSKDAPPRRPKPSELAIDVSPLHPGSIYPGDVDEGKAYSLDTQGNISDENGNFIQPNEELRTILKNSHKKGGRFRVTPVKRYVVELTKAKNGWSGIFLGQLSKPLEIPVPSTPVATQSYSPGDSYPLNKVEGKTFSVLQRDKRLIATKERNGVRFVSNTLTEPAKRAALEQIQLFLSQAYARGHRISKITVTPAGDVVYVYNNEAYFVGNAPEGASGFAFDDLNSQ